MPDDAGVLAALLGSPHLALVGVDLDGVITRWSDGASVLYGWSAAEVVGQPLAMLAPPDRLTELTALREAVAAGQDRPAIETVRRSKDGGEVDVQAHAFAVRDSQGRVTGILALYLDLSDTRRAVTALSASERELKVRFERSPVAQSRLSASGELLAINEEMARLLGRTADDVVGTDALLLVAPDDRAAVARAVEQVAAGEVDHVQLEGGLLTAAGAVLRMIFTGVAVREQSGPVVLAVSAQDVTELRTAEVAARTQAARFAAVLETMPVAVFSYDRQGRCTFAQGRVARIVAGRVRPH